MLEYGSSDAITLVAFCTSGLEGAVALELRKYGYKIIYSSSGRIFFTAPLENIPFLNMKLKSADRIAILVKNFRAETFDELFDEIRSSDFHLFVEKNANITIEKIKITNSKLSATGAVASVAKKAMIENLSGTNESGPRYDVILLIKNDEVHLLLDTTGNDSLAKRGYRLKSGRAPLRETIAAAVVLLSRWSDEPLFDPFCGSGTIPIEAATLDLPNLNRKYSSEEWKVLKEYWKRERLVLRNELKEYGALKSGIITGSDRDCEIIKIAQENYKRALKVFGFARPVELKCADFRNLPVFRDKAWIISNLPYGERLKEDEILPFLPKLREKFQNSNFYLLHPSDKLEKFFGKAQKKIRFQNSGIWTYLYMYY